MLKNIIEDNPNEQFIVAFNFKHEAERLLKAFPKKKVALMDKNGLNVEKWNGGEIDIFLLHPASAGHGLNLQKNDKGNTVIWFGFNWSLELYMQLNARLIRQGNTKPTKILHLSIGDIEYKLMSKLGDKELIQDRLMEALK